MLCGGYATSILSHILEIIFVIAAITVISTYGSQVIYTAAAGAVAAVGIYLVVTAFTHRTR